MRKTLKKWPPATIPTATETDFRKPLKTQRFPKGGGKLAATAADEEREAARQKHLDEQPWVEYQEEDIG